jgi:translation initiation factor IF-2
MRRRSAPCAGPGTSFNRRESSEPEGAAVRGDRSDRRALGRDHARPGPRADPSRRTGRDAQGPRPSSSPDRGRGAHRAVAADQPAAATAVSRAATRALHPRPGCVAERSAEAARGGPPGIGSGRAGGDLLLLRRRAGRQQSVHPASSQEPDQPAVDTLRREYRRRRAGRGSSGGGGGFRARPADRASGGASGGGQQEPRRRNPSGACTGGGGGRARDARSILQRARSAARAGT